MVSPRRRASAYRPNRFECHLVGPSEIRELHPHVNTDDILGGVWIPSDACVDAGKGKCVYIGSKMATFLKKILPVAITSQRC